MAKSQELADVIERHSGSNGRFPTSIPGLDLFHADRRLDWAPVLYEPSLCVLASGRKEVIVNGRTHHYDSAHCALVWIDMPLLCRIPRSCLGLQLRFDPVVVGELLAKDPPDVPEGECEGWVQTPIGPKVLDAVLRLVSLLDTPSEVAALSPLVTREIVYRILAGPHGGRLRKVATSGDPAHRVASAIGRLKQELAEGVLVEDLASEAGMGRSSFHRHFKAVTGLSPIQFQKRLRLLEAKRLMLGGLTAKEAGKEVGFASPAQFSRDYRRFFGATPRKDVAALLARAD